ncbi:hypothetical protein HYFRA_00009572 [Hymenoscyphus fraxineus]|uniref:Uncharacterized protein n=1 Tax=Hymenoscyphus fraxineus TaxID=746836 RepID=A0A9N9KZW0_9HELO|nr:hypothetical protein HYFRA_00009572 [Hymenoscyphus fraxineus]
MKLDSQVTVVNLDLDLELEAERKGKNSKQNGAKKGGEEEEESARVQSQGFGGRSAFDVVPGPTRPYIDGVGEWVTREETVESGGETTTTNPGNRLHLHLIYMDKLGIALPEPIILLRLRQSRRYSMIQPMEC